MRLSTALSFAFSVLLSAGCSFGQSFNLGAGIVRSEGLGFNEVYGLGMVEASLNHPSLFARVGIELLDAEKSGQDGCGANLDITLTKPFSDKWGVIAFYRPSWIHQTDYSKDAHSFGTGLAILTKHNGRWDFFISMSQDDYSMRTGGFELRHGTGHWLRVKVEGFQLTHPASGKKLKANRVSLVVAPRISW